MDLIKDLNWIKANLALAIVLIGLIILIFGILGGYGRIKLNGKKQKNMTYVGIVLFVLGALSMYFHKF